MRRKVIAITGGIGSGKSEVARILRTWGYETVDCDELGRRVGDMPEVVAQVQALLGGDSVVNGRLNRSYIRAMVFNDEKLLKQYGQIFYGKIKQLLSDSLQLTKGEVVFVEIAVPDAFYYDWTEVWRVESTNDKRIERVVARDGVLAESVRRTLSMQQAYKGANRIISNNGSLKDLAKALKRAVADATQTEEQEADTGAKKKNTKKK